MMLNAIKNDVVLTESDYRILKIDRDTLLYLLQKAYDYETQYMLQRSITVYGLREYQIEHEDEEGSWYEDAEEYVSKQILVSNEDTECMLRLDWQMLYMYSILASMGREDRGETEGVWDWEITVKDVDVAFDQIAMKYDYAFNVMTDENPNMILQHARAYRIKRKFTETRTQPVKIYLVLSKQPASQRLFRLF